MSELSTDYNHLALLQCTRQPLRELHGWPEQVSKLSIHVDGSFCPVTGDAAWRFVVIPYDRLQRRHYAGHLSCTVSVTPGTGDYLGAGTASCGVGEIHGVTWALMYVLQLNRVLTPRVGILFDPMHAFGTACSVYRNNVHAKLAAVSAGICEMVKSITTLSWVHEPSHEQHPFDEFADVGAKWRRKHGDAMGQWSSPAMQWVMNDASHASWAYLFTAPESVRKAYPLKCVADRMYLSATVDPVPTMQIPSAVITDAIDNFQEDDVRPLDVADMQPLAFMHFNVKTLLTLAKRQCHKRQITEDKIFTTTFPEARSRVTEVKVEENFIIVSSASDRGFGGCEM